MSLSEPESELTELEECSEAEKSDDTVSQPSSDEDDSNDSEKEQASNKEDPPKPQTSNEEGVDPVAGEKRKLAALTSAVSDSEDESWELTEKLIKEGGKLIGLGATGMIFYITPTLQFILGYFYYNEDFSLVKFLSFIIIWIAVIIYLKDLYETN